MLVRLSILPPLRLWHFPLLHIRGPPPEARPGPAGPTVIWFLPPFPDGCGFFVTVTFVPTPYSELSTSPWAFFTPEEAAVTVITRPIPNARPRAMTTDWRIRRRSSRRR